MASLKFNLTFEEVKKIKQLEPGQDTNERRLSVSAKEGEDGQELSDVESDDGQDEPLVLKYEDGSEFDDQGGEGADTGVTEEKDAGEPKPS